MNKFNYGTFDSSVNDGPFMDGSYTEPTSEQMTRKELSFPLTEIRDFINAVLPLKEVDGDEKIIGLRLNDDNLIQYTLDGETWLDTASGGHIIYDKDGRQMPQKTRLLFQNTDVENVGDYTIVKGVTGPAGVGVSSIVQTGETTVSGGENIWTATLTNGNTYDFVVRNGQKGEDGEKGDPGDGLIILGVYPALEDLQQAHPTGSKGDIYIVGTSDSNPAYVWDVDDSSWSSIGKIRGEKGAKGDTGNTGATGTSVQSIVDQTPTSVSGGEHSIKVTLSNGASNTFSVYNGQAGAPGEGMPTGGSIGQVLTKKSATAYDSEWANVDGDNVAFDGTTGYITENDTNVQDAIDTLDVSLKSANNVISGKQDILISGDTIKTIDNKTIMGSGNLALAKSYSNIAVSVTPTAIGTYNVWDTQNNYGYKADITVTGMASTSVIVDIVMTDTLLEAIAPIVTTDTNKITVYTEDATALSGTIFTLVTREL